MVCSGFLPWSQHIIRPTFNWVTILIQIIIGLWLLDVSLQSFMLWSWTCGFWSIWREINLEPNVKQVLEDTTRLSITSLHFRLLFNKLGSNPQNSFLVLSTSGRFSILCPDSLCVGDCRHWHFWAYHCCYNGALWYGYTLVLHNSGSLTSSRVPLGLISRDAPSLQLYLRYILISWSRTLGRTQVWLMVWSQ